MLKNDGSLIVSNVTPGIRNQAGPLNQQTDYLSTASSPLSDQSEVLACVEALKIALGPRKEADATYKNVLIPNMLEKNPDPVNNNESILTMLKGMFSSSPAKIYQALVDYCRPTSRQFAVIDFIMEEEKNAITKLMYEAEEIKKNLTNRHKLKQQPAILKTKNPVEIALLGLTTQSLLPQINSSNYHDPKVVNQDTSTELDFHKLQRNEQQLDSPDLSGFFKNRTDDTLFDTKKINKEKTIDSIKDPIIKRIKSVTVPTNNSSISNKGFIHRSGDETVQRIMAVPLPRRSQQKQQPNTLKGFIYRSGDESFQKIMADSSLPKRSLENKQDRIPIFSTLQGKRQPTDHYSASYDPQEKQQPRAPELEQRAGMQQPSAPKLEQLLEGMQQPSAPELHQFSSGSGVAAGISDVMAGASIGAAGIGAAGIGAAGIGTAGIGAIGTVAVGAVSLGVLGHADGKQQPVDPKLHQTSAEAGGGASGSADIAIDATGYQSSGVQQPNVAELPASRSVIPNGSNSWYDKLSGPLLKSLLRKGSATAVMPIARQQIEKMVAATVKQTSVNDLAAIEQASVNDLLEMSKPAIKNIKFPIFYLKDGIVNINVQLLNEEIITPLIERAGSYYVNTPNNEFKTALSEVFYDYVDKKWLLTTYGRREIYSKEDMILIKKIALGTINYAATGTSTSIPTDSIFSKRDLTWTTVGGHAVAMTGVTFNRFIYNFLKPHEKHFQVKHVSDFENKKQMWVINHYNNLIISPDIINTIEQKSIVHANILDRNLFPADAMGIHYGTDYKSYLNIAGKFYEVSVSEVSKIIDIGGNIKLKVFEDGHSQLHTSKVLKRCRRSPVDCFTKEQAGSSSSHYTIKPVNIVYRVDSRDMWDIKRAGGMFPKRGSGIELDDQLSHHFDSETPDNHVSSLISTTSSLHQAIEHASYMKDKEENTNMDYDETESIVQDYTTYLYAIRPSNNFYQVEGSLLNARKNFPADSSDYARINSLLTSYGKMDEWIAVNGFTSDRILNYAELTAEMLEDTNQQAILFRGDRWITTDTHYNSAYDIDISNSEPYEKI